MILSEMLATDADAVFCDMAETYKIFDMESLPLFKYAKLAAGLRETSRIVKKMNGDKHTLESALLAMLIDEVRILHWSMTESARYGNNYPDSVYKALFEEKEQNDNGRARVYESPEEFEREFERLKEEYR